MLHQLVITIISLIFLYLFLMLISLGSTNSVAIDPAIFPSPIYRSIEYNNLFYLILPLIIIFFIYQLMVFIKNSHIYVISGFCSVYFFTMIKLNFNKPYLRSVYYLFKNSSQLIYGSFYELLLIFKWSIGFLQKTVWIYYAKKAEYVNGLKVVLWVFHYPLMWH